MLRLEGPTRITPRALRLLAAGAREQQQTVTRHASLIVAAAGRLWLDNKHTSAVPDTERRLREPLSAEVYLSLTSEASAPIVKAAEAHGLTVDVQVRMIIEAAGTPYEEEIEPRAPGVRPAVPRRPKFDPRRYARGPWVQATPPTRNVTAAVFGDPAPKGG